MRRSINRRLLISNLLVLAAFLGLAGAALDRAFRSSTESAIRERLQAHVYTLLTAAKEDDLGRMRLPDALAAPAFNQPDSGLYAEAVGEDGAYHWRSGSLLGRLWQLTSPTAVGMTRFHFADGLAILDQGVSWEDDKGKPIAYALTVAMDSATLREEQAGFRGTLWRWLGGVALVLLAVQILLVRWGLAPLRDMSAAVQRIESGESVRIEGPVPYELLGLSDNLNSLIQQNQQRQERVRHSLADLAHSMKTPLAVLRGAAEQGDINPVLRDLIGDQTRRIDEIVGYQRQRAAVAGSSAVNRPIALAPIVRRLCASLDKVHRARGVRCSVEIDDRLKPRVDQGDLFELLGNLVENAFKHCSTQVAVGARSEPGAMLIEVEDDGPGIAPQEVERLLRRGERADQQHPGEGIGLAVVSEIVRHYQGDLKVDRSALGGARIRVRIPT
ncbi:MAG: GHKL domain-containing protein [Chromatiaceae bacterium]|nr:GHKL domain-containing protein [Gammaproteobacteria bacterium]MCP5305773.1 GHKL domain-containing protein [Chromatiaceae bacterium]MCP5312630.1 GHKL domain-containing protein [Chromatiaceae bacterium]